MAKIVKTLTVSWQWSGDKYSLRGFNLAVTPAAKNPKEEVVAAAFVETKEIKQTYSYKMGNVTLDKDAQYKIWVQAVYENSDSDWVATGGATVSDDGSATIITKTDREIQDVVNMASDNILTRQEKISLRREWQEIVYEFLEIESTAISQGIPSSNAAFSNFKSKGNALGTYLNGGTAWTISSNNKTSFPLWINDSNLGSNTSINGNTYRETFRVYYEAKVKILEEINKYKVNNVQIGAINIIRNSSNPKTLAHWKNDTGFSVERSTLLGENVFRILATDATEKFGATNRYRVEPNCQYTFAMDVYMDANVTSMDVFWLSREKGSASDYDSSTQFIKTWKETKSKWVRITGTFTTKATDYEGYIRIDNNGTTNSTTLNGLWFTKVKLEKGNKATDWSPALEDMENAYTIILTNEAQVIPTNSNRVPTSSTTYFTDIQVYKGTTQRNDYTIGTINSANGITVSKTSSRVNFAVSTNTALAADGGNFIIPITIDGKTFNKTFSWSCSKQGTKGDKGDKGDNAKNVTLTATSQVFKSTDGGKNFTPDSITIKAAYQNVSHTKWQHSLDGGKTWVDTGNNTNGVTIDGNGFTISKTSTLFTDKVTSIVVKDVTNNSSVYDTITITRLYDITDLQIGGKNMIKDSRLLSYTNGTGANKWEIYNTGNEGFKKLHINTDSTSWIECQIPLYKEIGTLNKDITISFEYQESSSGLLMFNFGVYNNSFTRLAELSNVQVSSKFKLISKQDSWKYVSYTFNPSSLTHETATKYAIQFKKNSGLTGEIHIRKPKLEFGTIATDWTPAPEDIDNNITDVKNSLDSFQDTVNHSFKDGIIEQAEAKAIAQHLKTLDAEKADIDKEYSTIYGNSLLKGTAKTNLEKAKKEFNNAHDSLKSTINTAISDGKITSTEKASVDSTFTTYNGILGTYKQRVQEALDAISSAKVNNIQVGGTNIIRNSRNPKNLACWDANVTEFKVANSGDIGENVFKLTATTAERFASTMRYRVEPNCQYTFSMDVWMEANVNDLDVFWLSRPKGSTESYVNAKKIISNWNATKVKWVRIAASFTTASNDYEGFIRIDNNGSSSTTDYAIWFTKVKLEKGNKATDWSPAPEDLENSYTIVLTNEAQVIPTDNSRKPISSTTYYTDIQVYQGTTQRTDYTIGTINSANGITVSKTSSRVNFAVSTGTALTADGGNFTIPITIDGKTFNKTFSWSCSKQGNKGNDAYTVILTNESHTFPTKNDGSISSAISTTTQVLAYKGASSVTPEIGTLPAVDGLTLSKNKTTITIQANTGTSLADSGSFNIPITVDGKSFTKTFSWSKSKKGDTGSKGDGAKSADIISSSQVFKSTDGGLTFSPATITMTPKLQNVTYSNWQYSTNGGSTWNGFSNSISGWSVSNGVLTISKDSSLFTSTITSVTFRLNTNDSSVYDTMTIVKLYDIADLEIGGRNYLQNSNFANGLDKWTVHDMSNNTGTNKSVSTVKGGSWADPNVNTLQIKGTNVTGRYGVRSSDIALVANTTYTISGYCAGHRVGKIQVNVRDKQNSDANIHTVEYNPVSGGNSLSKYYKFETTFTTTSNTLFALNLYAVNLADNGYAWFANVKLEKGNKASDWIPAQEDVDKNINDVKDSLNSFQDTVNHSFKDGIIEQAEAKAIAQHLKTLDAEKADIDKEYSTIHSNANLTGSAKTNLASAKTSFDSAHASLKSTINTVISDGRVTSSESDSVTSTFSTYNTQLGVYKQRVQEALDAIGSAKVNSVQIGGRNYIKDYQFKKNDVWKRNRTSESFIDTTNGYGYLTASTANPWLYQIMPFDVFKQGQKVTIQYEIKCEGVSKNTATDSMIIRTQLTGYENDSGGFIKDVCILGQHENEAGSLTNWTKKTITGTIGDIGAAKSIWFRLYARNFTGKIYFRNVKLELGNKATDLSPAPEDEDANLSDLKETILGQIEEDVAGLQNQNSSIVNRLDEVFSENVVSSHQKPDLKLEFDTITSQYETMKSMVNEFNEPAITGQFNTLTTIYNTLKKEVEPIFKDMNVATEINGAILKSRFYNFYEQYNVVYLAIQTYVRGTLDKVNAQVNAVSDGVNMAITKSDSALETTNTISKHFNFTDSGWVEIFAMVNGVAGKFKTQITDQKLSFQESGKEVAYLSNQELYITQAQILNSLQLGNVGMTTTSKGGIMYQWRG